MTTRHPSGYTGTSRSTASTSSYRRNLLSGTHNQHQPPHQPRRPTTSSTASSAETVHVTLDQTIPEGHNLQDSVSSSSTANNVRNDIIIRDEHGKFEVDEPVPLPVLEGDGEDLDDEDARSKADTRLIDLWRSHSRQHIDAGELHNAVETSLQNKVISLDDDKWMYEPEEETESMQAQ